MNTYDFDTKLKAGRASEKWLAKILGASLTLGGPYDLVTPTGKRVDVKRDEEAQRTNNLAIEAMSVEGSGAQGWALKAGADFTVHHLPDPSDCTVYVIRSSTLRAALPKITAACKLKRTSSVGRGGQWTTTLYTPWIPNLLQWGVIEKTWRSYYGEPFTLP